MKSVYPKPYTYRGAGGVSVKLRPTGLARRQRWDFRFIGFRLWHGPYPSKFAALLAAAHACGRSGIDMNFSPVGPGRPRIRRREAPCLERTGTQWKGGTP